MQGFVDILNENLIAGWAHDPDRPDTEVIVQIQIDGRPAGQVIAGGFREDLKAAGLGDGRKGFSFDPRPFITNEQTPLRVVFALSGETLPNGRGTLAKSRTRSLEDWDQLHRHRLDLPPVMTRLQAFTPESWPLISVVMPTYNSPLAFLERAIQSVRNQIYPRWELCIADDASPDRTVAAWLQKVAATDPRVKVTLLDKNAGISGATNAALALAGGSFTALLDHDDELTPDALAEVAARLLQEPAVEVIYTDQDKCNEANERFEPFHKPEWSPIFLLGVMYVGHLLVARTNLIRQLGGCDSRFDKVQDFELMLRLSEATDRIAHIPRILYHWRTLPGSIATSSNSKGPIEALQAAAVQAHLDRRHVPLRAVSHPTLPHRVQLRPKHGYPDTKVSIIIPSRDAPQHISRCLKSIFEFTTHPNFEVIVVDNGTTDPEALAVLASHPICWLKDEAPFNFSRVNNRAVAVATGDVLLFLNNDTEVQTPDWLQILLAHLNLPGVGAVGPLLLYPNGTVQHAGVVLGFRGTADHVMRGLDRHGDGYAGSLACSREVSAVTAACMMLRRADYVALGGMHEAFAMIYQDVDLCLRIRESGKTILYVGNVALIHHESVSRGTHYEHVDRELLIDRWSRDLARGDPYYNPNFTRNHHTYTVR